MEYSVRNTVCLQFSCLLWYHLKNNWNRPPPQKRSFCVFFLLVRRARILFSVHLGTLWSLAEAYLFPLPGTKGINRDWREIERWLQPKLKFKPVISWPGVHCLNHSAAAFFNVLLLVFFSQTTGVNSEWWAISLATITKWRCWCCHLVAHSAFMNSSKLGARIMSCNALSVPMPSKNLACQKKRWSYSSVWWSLLRVSKSKLFFIFVVLDAIQLQGIQFKKKKKKIVIVWCCCELYI